MYVMFVLIAAGGLTMAASMAPIAKDFKIEKIPVELFGFAMPALVFALVAQPDLRRRRPAVLRLALGPDRPRVHHGPGIRDRRRWRCSRSASPARTRWCSCWSPRSTSAFTARSSACSRQPRATPSAPSSPPRMPACSTPPRARARCSCPSPPRIAKVHGWGTVFMLAMGFNLLAAFLALVVLEAHARAALCCRSASVQSELGRASGEHRDWHRRHDAGSGRLSSCDRDIHEFGGQMATVEPTSIQPKRYDRRGHPAAEEP